jgi:hypothetical protein
VPADPGNAAPKTQKTLRASHGNVTQWGKFIMAKSNVAQIHVMPERNGEKIDELTMLLKQLCAQLMVIHAGGLESFDECSGEIKEHYIWAMYCEAERAQELCKSL